MPALSDFKYLNMSMATKVIIHNAVLPLAGGQGPSQPGTKAIENRYDIIQRPSGS